MVFRPSMTPQEIKSAYIAGTGTKGKENYKKGVMRTTESPTIAAARKLPQMREGWLRSLDNGDIERGLMSVTNGSWQQSASGKGAQNYGTGTAAGADKLAAARAAKQSEWDALRREIDSMPNNTYDERMARQRAWSDGQRRIWGSNRV